MYFFYLIINLPKRHTFSVDMENHSLTYQKYQKCGKPFLGEKYVPKYSTE